MTESPDDAPPSPDESPSPPGGAPGVDTAATVAHLRAGMEEIRTNLRKYGAAVGAGATAVFAGISWTTIHNLFPVPRENLGWLASILALLAVLTAFAAAAGLFGAQRRIVFDTADPTRNNTLRKREQKIVERVLAEHAHQEFKASIHDVEKRALRLERRARRSSGTRREVLELEARRLNGLVSAAGVRAALSVLESRSERQFRLTSPFGLFPLGSVAIVSALAVLMLADYSKGERDLIDVQQMCVDADTYVSQCDDAWEVDEPSPPAAPGDRRVIARLAACASDKRVARQIPVTLRRQAVLECAGLESVD